MLNREMHIKESTLNTRQYRKTIHVNTCPVDSMCVDTQWCNVEMYFPIFIIGF